ncbi:MAG: hypothetical protein GY711_14195, partial [bacterium]|nr:hypothetical protein [bacterium]
ESSTPEDREPRLSGRYILGADHTWDDEQDRRYLLGRTGVDARMENPFGHGGGAKFRAEAFQRTADVENGNDEDESHLRIDRLSWYRGDTRERAGRIELGRFLQDAFPEFGVLDGVEYQQRTAAGHRWGASLGLAPIPNGELESSDDMQVALFFRHDAPVDGTLDWGVGAQKTWHEGAADRDLVVADANWRPSERAWLFGSAWVDYYTSGDDVKSGLELTELRLGGNWRISASSGVHADLSRVRWPDIERYEFTMLPASELDDSEVLRLSLGGWHQLSDDVRLNGRVNWWEDEEQDGAGGEVRAAWRDLLWERGEVNATLFTNTGAFSSVTGARFGGTRSTGRGYLAVTWELAKHEQDGFVGTQEDLLQQVLRGSWDTTLGDDWNLSLSADQRFGDEQDSFALGFYLQRRF